ncbi:MAG: hypothetical protein CM15mP84_05680 [Cellvibrionales bacterium]|nr:MAG: hypothetical protein CM15mP84_05680 [Cellvibrionales bacterium]
MAVNGEDGTVLWDSYAIPNAPISTGDTKAGTKIYAPSVHRCGPARPSISRETC